MLAFRRPRIDIATALGALPDDYRTVQMASRWLVIGPTGLFLVADGRGEGHGAAAIGAAARLLRAALFEHVGPVPFVERIVVTDTATDEPGARGGEAARLPPTLLAAALREGHTTMPPERMKQIEAAARALADGRMAECSTSPAPAGPSRPCTTSEGEDDRCSWPTPTVSTGRSSRRWRGR